MVNNDTKEFQIIKLIDPMMSGFLKNMNGRSRVFMSVLIVFSIILDTLLCFLVLNKGM
ncbi:MAG: hypothetical protein IKK33_17875 [Lachnospiraceae bacterium]|nr:hypothetical protein [Lachnospiraceae bacterium]